MPQPAGDNPADSSCGALYVVATPIGNLGDISARAIEILKSVDMIAAEDTRHSARLLAQYDIRTPLLALHDHNERARADELVKRISGGVRMALISDAGTPLISDPGYRLVSRLREAGQQVVPVPGPCALITALSGAGLATDRFAFEGFLPAKRSARTAALEAVVKHTATLVFYESPHRIVDSLQDISDIFGQRRLVLARELTKRFETYLEGNAESLLLRLRENSDQTRGEFVVMIEGAAYTEEQATDIDPEHLLKALLAASLGVKQAASVAAEVLGGKRKEWYERVQHLKDGG